MSERMTATMMLLTAAVALGGAPHAFAQKVDSHGQCRGPDGKAAKLEACAIMGQPVVNRCRDPKGRLARCGAPKPPATSR